MDAAENSLPVSQDAFRQLVNQANAGDADSLNELRTLLDGHPEIWQKVGDLATHSEATLIALIAGNDKLLSESLARQVTQIRAEVFGPEPSRLERMAVDRLVVCWLQLQFSDRLAAQPGITLAMERHLRRWQDQAHRRYMAAVRSLMLVQRLIPAGGELPSRHDLRVFPRTGGTETKAKTATG